MLVKVLVDVLVGLTFIAVPFGLVGLAVVAVWDFIDVIKSERKNK
jgi:hypothetical protein